jgi:tRNA(Ile)-lysidine synthase
MKLRPWEPGDRFHPFGMNGTKKISDYLIDEKVDRYTKDNQWVLVNRESIIWVCGRRISDEVKVTPETTQFAELSFHHIVG